MLVTLTVYQAVLLGLGYWTRSRAQTVEGCFIGGRTVDPWVTALTYRLSAVVILFSFTFYIAAQFQGAANTFTAFLISTF